MKKLLYIFLLILSVTYVEAVSFYNITYNDVKNNVETEITKYNNYETYVITPGAYQIDYVYNNNTLSFDSDYQMSGLLNLYEYETSGGKKSYLYDANNYWMMTESDSNNTYITDNENDLGYSVKPNGNLSGFRIAVYIKGDATVTGSGTYRNPWKFNE